MLKRNEVAYREAIRLRVDERKSLNEISKIMSLSKGTLSLWLKDIPLTEKEKKEKMSIPNIGHRNYHDTEEWAFLKQPSKAYRQVKDTKHLSSSQKGKIAEVLNGFNVYGSPFDGDCLDWVIEKANKTYRIQVRWGSNNDGRPCIRLRKSNGRGKSKRYANDDFDFIIGYDLFSDTAFIFSSKETSNHTSRIAITQDSIENWDKIC